MQSMRLHGLRFRSPSGLPLCGADARQVLQLWFPCLLLSLAAESESRAQPIQPQRGVEPVEIIVEGGDACVGAADFFARLRRRTARVERAEPQSGARQFVVSFQFRDRVTGQLLVREADGLTAVRQVSGDSCAEVAEALALVAAVAVDPNATLSSAEPSETAETSSEPAVPDTQGQPPEAADSAGLVADANVSTPTSVPVPPSLRPSAMDPIAPRGRRTLDPSRLPARLSPAVLDRSTPAVRGAVWSHGFGPSAVMTSGMETQVAMGIGAHWWSVRETPGLWEGPLLTVTGFATVEDERPAPSDARLPASAAIRYRLYGAEGSVCPVDWRALRALSLAPCVSGMAGGVRAVGSSIPGAGEVVRGPFVTVGLTLRPLVRVASSWALVGAAGVGIPLVRPVIKVRPDAVVAEGADVNVFASLGISWRLPSGGASVHEHEPR